MKPNRLLILIMLLFPSIAVSDGVLFQAYGKITTPTLQEGKMEIRIKYNKRVQNAYTSEDGSYRLIVPDSGEYFFSVFYDNQWTEPHTIFVSRKPVRYNFLIESSGKKYILRRQ